jgi:preprotein translocase subunit YajC
MSQDVFLVVALAILIAMMFLSSRKRKKQAQTLLDSVKVGAAVVLHSGITGTVVSIDGDRAIIETTPGVKISFLKGAIRSVDTSAKAVTPKTAPTKAVAPKAVAKKPAAKKPAAKKPAVK